MNCNHILRKFYVCCQIHIILHHLLLLTSSVFCASVFCCSCFCKKFIEILANKSFTVAKLHAVVCLCVCAFLSVKNAKRGKKNYGYRWCSRLFILIIFSLIMKQYDDIDLRAIYIVLLRICIYLLLFFFLFKLKRQHDYDDNESGFLERQKDYIEK